MKGTGVPRTARVPGTQVRHCSELRVCRPSGRAGSDLISSRESSGPRDTLLRLLKLMLDKERRCFFNGHRSSVGRPSAPFILRADLSLEMQQLEVALNQREWLECFCGQCP